MHIVLVFHEKGTLSYLSLLNECTLQVPFIWNQLYQKCSWKGLLEQEQISHWTVTLFHMCLLFSKILNFEDFYCSFFPKFKKLNISAISNKAIILILSVNLPMVNIYNFFYPTTWRTSRTTYRWRLWLLFRWRNSWNAVYVSGGWRLVQPNWAALSVNTKVGAYCSGGGGSTW